MSRIHPEDLGPDLPDCSLAADVLVREEPDDEEDEQDEVDDDNEEDDDDGEDDGHSE